MDTSLAPWQEISLVLASTWAWLERLAYEIWSGFQWPHAVFFMFVIIIISFKVELKSTILRLKAVRKDGLELHAPEKVPPAQDLDGAEFSPARTQSFTEYPAVMQESIRHTDQDLAALAEDKRYAFLRENISHWKAMWWFENTYANIFGGQIQLLRYLVPFGGLGVSEEDIDAFWFQYKSKFSAGMDYVLSEQFLSFLYSRVLITKVEGRISIAPQGTEFLIWMTRFSRSDARLW